MSRRFARVFAAVTALVLMLCVSASAKGTVSTTVVMRVSHMTQSAVVDAGEDLSIDVSIDGVQPTRYQWYFNDQAISGANQKVYNIVNASVEDSGIYRLDAFDDAGTLLVSMDFSARVIDHSIPKSGDASLPVGIAFAGLAACALAALVLIRRVRA